MTKMGKQPWKISPHTVVGTPESPMRVVPLACDVIDGSLFEEVSPLVVPEFQPQCELCFVDLRKMAHERL